MKYFKTSDDITEENRHEQTHGDDFGAWSIARTSPDTLEGSGPVFHRELSLAERQSYARDQMNTVLEIVAIQGRQMSEREIDDMYERFLGGK